MGLKSPVLFPIFKVTILSPRHRVDTSLFTATVVVLIADHTSRRCSTKHGAHVVLRDERARRGMLAVGTPVAYWRSWRRCRPTPRDLCVRACGILRGAADAADAADARIAPRPGHRRSIYYPPQEIIPLIHIARLAHYLQRLTCS